MKKLFQFDKEIIDLLHMEKQTNSNSSKFNPKNPNNKLTPTTLCLKITQKII